MVRRNMTQEGERIPWSIERPPGNRSKGEFYVTGSGMVRVPAARANEIPKMIMEHHELEAERARQLAHVRRVI